MKPYIKSTYVEGSPDPKGKLMHETYSICQIDSISLLEVGCKLFNERKMLSKNELQLSSKSLNKQIGPLVKFHDYNLKFRKLVWFN